MSGLTVLFLQDLAVRGMGLLHLAVAACFFALLAWLAYAVTVRWLRISGLALRLAGAYVVGAWLLAALFHLLMALGTFRQSSALWLGLALLTFGWSLDLLGRDTAREGVADLARLSALWRRQPPWRRRVVGGFLVLFAGLLLVWALALPLNRVDSWTYHGFKAAGWVQGARYETGYRAPGGWEYYRTFPAGGEVFTSWAMLFTRSDALAGVPDWIHWLAFALVFFALAREFGASRSASGFLAALLVTAPVLADFVGSGYVDTAQSTLLLAGILFLGRYGRQPAAGPLYLAAAAFGLMLAIKVNALGWLAVVAAVCIAWLWRHRHAARTEDLSRWLVVILLVLPLAPWLVLNWRDSGYVLGCVPLTVGDIRLGEVPPNLRWLLENTYAWTPYRLADEALAFGNMLRMLMLPGVLLLFAVWALRAQWRCRPWLSAMAIAVAVAVVIQYFSPSFSVVRLGWAAGNGRFILPAVALLLAAGASRIFDDPRWRRWAIGFAVAGLWTHIAMHGITFFIGATPVELRWVPLLTLGIGALTWLFFWICHRFAGRAGQVLFIGLLAAVIILFSAAGLRDGLGVARYSRVIQLRNMPRYLEDVMQAMVREPGAKTIDVTAGPLPVSHQWFVYPLMGMRLENRICHLSTERNGEIIPHHPQPLARAQPDYKVWRNRLLAGQVTHVVSFDPASSELEWMWSYPDAFTRLAGRFRHWGVFRVNPPPVPPARK
jgi:hypothetical protein